MKIVLSNIALDTPHGSEVWTWTVARELLRRHHSVLIISAKYGKIAREMERFGCELICPRREKDVRCDIAILNHANALSKHLSKLKPDHTVYVTHGRHKPETPFKGDRNVAVSKEVAGFWKGINFEVIPNPVAPEYFNMQGFAGNAIWGNHRHKIPQWLKTGLLNNPSPYPIYHNLNTANQKAVMNYYAECRIVFGTGRWIYDGMAAGMNCVVTDGKRTLGHITPANYQSSQNFNMTVRNPVSKLFNPKALDLILKNYDPERGAALRQIAYDKHHVRIIVDKLLEV